MDSSYPSLIPEDVYCYLESFNRRKYKDAFATYRENCGDFLTRLDTADIPEAAKRIVSEIDGRIMGIWKKRKLLDMKFFLVIYVTPYLLSEKSEKGRALAEALREEWLRSHPNNTYELGIYEDLADGFNDTILGFRINIGKNK